MNSFVQSLAPFLGNLCMAISFEGCSFVYASLKNMRFGLKLHKSKEYLSINCFMMLYSLERFSCNFRNFILTI